ARNARPKHLFAGLHRGGARLIELAPARVRRAAADERIAEITAVAVDNDREIEKHEIARFDRACRGGAADLLAALPAAEVAVDQSLPACLLARDALYETIGVEFGHAGLEFPHGGFEGGSGRSE